MTSARCASGLARSSVDCPRIRPDLAEMSADSSATICAGHQAVLVAFVDRLRGRGLVDAAGGFSDAGRATRERIEAVTEELAAPAYDVLSADELVAGARADRRRGTRPSTTEPPPRPLVLARSIRPGMHDRACALGRVASSAARATCRSGRALEIWVDRSLAARVCREPSPGSVSASNRQTTTGG